MIHSRLPAFKAYDIRGLMPTEINPTIAYHIGRALAVTQPQAQTAVVGMDSRLTSPELARAVAAGLAAEGVTVHSLGLCGTEETYYAAGAGHADIGIMVTASHNPIEYNGMKFVKRGGHPFSPEDDLKRLEETTRSFLADPTPETFPEVPEVSYREAYVNHLLNFINPADIKPQTIVINAGHGAAGPTADAILARLPQLNVIRLHHAPDGTFPAGIPNPLLPQNRISTSTAVAEHKANMGVAWDGDFDRCFLYDESGAFVSNYYLVGLMVEAVLAQNPGSAIVHDPRLFRDTVATITACGGTPVKAKVGHGFIKPAMREHNAPFAGEISGHFYFRDFFFCDTGMLPWLLVLAQLGKTGQTLGQAIAQRQAQTPASDELNFKTPVPAKTFLELLRPTLENIAPLLAFDGVEITTETWRANIRTSSNEPLLRLNVEAKTQADLTAHLAALTHLIEAQGATPDAH